MIEKRGITIALLVMLLVFFSQGAIPPYMPYSDSSMQEEYENKVISNSIKSDSSVSLQYTYALGLDDAHNDNEKDHVDDDDDCSVNSPDPNKLVSVGILLQKIGNQAMKVTYPEHSYAPGYCNPPYASPCIEQEKGQCTWHNLPLNKKGCYFFAYEYDGLKDNHYGKDVNQDDCAGWFVPAADINNPTTSIIGPDLMATPALYLDPEDGEPNYRFPAVFGNEHGNKLETGQLSNNDIGGDAGCIFHTRMFNSLDRTFICLQQQEEYRWYICDENNIGKYIRIEEEKETEEGKKKELTGKGLVCTKEGEEYTWETRDLKCGDEGIDCDNDEQVCTQSQFSFLPDAPAGQKCCGDDGLADFGTDTGTRKCLDKRMIGAAAGVVDIIWNNNLCEGKDWCWANAIGEAKFHILTIKKPLEQPYDLVSNSQNWLACDATSPEGTQDISLGLTDPSFRENANRFYCYREGEHGSWADCVEGEPRALADTDVNGVKTRLVGDGLFALPVKSSTTPTSVAVDLDKLKDFYDDASLDVVNYDTLEFYVKFTKDIIPPADVTLIIRGPQQAGTPLEYFHQKVLGYAIGNPVLEKDRWIHVQVPLPASGWYGVSSIELQSEPADNEIIVRNIYLSKAGKTQFCSGEKSDREGQSAWLDGLDFYGDLRTTTQIAPPALSY